MKNLKTKLLAAVAMLAVSAICLTSATFAWFTLSTNPEIAGLESNIVTNENLEIAYRASSTVPGVAAVGDTKKADTYGNLISSATDSQSATVSGTVPVGKGNYTSDYAVVNKTLRPCTLAKSGDQLVLSSGEDASAATAGTFYYPVYGTDGRIDYMKALTTIAIPGAEDGETTGFGYLIEKTCADSETPSCTAAGVVTGGIIYGYYVDLWVRTNVEGDLLISGAEKRSSGADSTGGGSNFVATSISTGTQDEVLAKSIGVAYTLGSETTTALVGTVGTADDTAKRTKTFTEGVKGATPADNVNDLGTLTANTDTQLRIYVYLEGAKVTNAAASINGVTVSGTLNLQFKNSAITKGSMDKVETTAAGGGAS